MEGQHSLEKIYEETGQDNKRYLTAEPKIMIIIIQTHLISQPQLSLIQLHTPAHTLRNAKTFIIQLTRELQTHPTQTRTTRSVDPQTRCELCNDIVEVSCFESGR